jgi:exodeoxyribonuclease-3
LPEERAWFDGFSIVDSLIVSVLNKEPDNYTWWTVRVPTARPSNKWRIDYCLVSEALRKNKEQLFCPKQNILIIVPF